MNRRRGVWVAGGSAAVSRWLKGWPEDWTLEKWVAAIEQDVRPKTVPQSSKGINSRIAHR